MTYSELVKARYSCRKFSDKPVEEEKLRAILDAGISAPTAKNAQPVKIWVIKSESALEKIKSCAPFVWMKNAPVVIAVGGTEEGAFVRPSDNRNFEDVDAVIVATHIMLAIHNEGLGSTWVGYFDAPKVKELFPEMKAYDLVALFPVGYPADDAMPADRHYVRKNFDDIVSVL
ncbi:MAG: nitroreductase family protein [Synergistaceae bacterium]|nr:nitroreductase family protein [Synergistaceae bacterium]